MVRLLSNIRPVGPFISFRSNIDSSDGCDGVRMYHSTSSNRLNSILNNGLKTSYTGDSRLTSEVEAILEEHRPEDRFPSRVSAIFTFSDIGIAEDIAGDIILSFRLSDSPCAGWGVNQTGEIMGLANIIRNMKEHPEAYADYDESNIERSAKSFWDRDVIGPIHSKDDFQEAENIMGVGLSEVYFPCSIPPDILRVEQKP